MKKIGKEYHGCYPQDWFIKMLSIAVLLAMVLGLVWANVAFGYTTYQEAFDAGVVKHSAKDYVGAREDFDKALILLPSSSLAQVKKAHTYYDEKNYTQALIEFDKVLIMVGDGISFDKDLAQLMKGYCYMDKNNYPAAIVEYIKMLKIKNGNTLYKSDVWNKMVELKPDWNIVIQDFKTDNWEGYFYHAKTKEQLKDWQGAYADYENAWALRPKDQASMELIQQAMEEVSIMLKRKTTP